MPAPAQVRRTRCCTSQRMEAAQRGRHAALLASKCNTLVRPVLHVKACAMIKGDRRIRRALSGPVKMALSGPVKMALARCSRAGAGGRWR